MTILVVGHEKTTHVQLDRGALKVSVADKAPAWAPLRRLGGVVSYPAAQWSSPALLACVRKAVGVVFCNTAGHFVGRFSPVLLPDRKTLNDLLRLELDWFLRTGKGKRMLRRWLAVRTGRWQKAVALVQGSAVSGDSGKNDQASVFGLVSGMEADLLRTQSKQLANPVVVAALFDEMQCHYGLADAQLAHCLSGFSVGEALTQLVIWRLAAQWPGYHRKTVPWLERKARFLCQQELAALHRFLVENRHELENHLSDLLRHP